MAFSVVQTKTFTNSSSSSVSLVFGSALTVGNLVVVGLDYGSSGTASLSGGGTWNSKTQTDAANTQKVDIFWCTNVTSSGITTITCGTLTAVTICGVEFSGNSTGAIDASDATKAFAANVLTSNSISTTNTGSQSATFTEGTSGHNSTVQVMAFLASSGLNELIVGHFGDTSNTQSSIGPGSGFTTGVVNLGVSGTGANGLIYQEVTGGGGSPPVVTVEAKVRPKPTRPRVGQPTYIVPAVVNIPTAQFPPSISVVKPRRLAALKQKEPLRIVPAPVQAAGPAPQVTAIAKVTPKRLAPVHKVRLVLTQPPAILAAGAAPVVTRIALVKPRRLAPVQALHVGQRLGAPVVTGATSQVQLGLPIVGVGS